MAYKCPSLTRERKGTAMSRLTLLLLLLILCRACIALAQTTPVPPLMNFQGRLTRPDGTPVADGTYTITFNLWDALTNGNKRWEQTLNPVPVKNGVFGVLLNFTTGFTTGNDIN